MKDDKVRKTILTVLLIFFVSLVSQTAYGLSSWDTYPLTSSEARNLGYTWYTSGGNIYIGSSNSATSAPQSHGSITGTIHIPTSIDGNRVIGIGPYAFYGLGNVKKVTIPRSVTIIGNYAFSECRSLTSVDFCEGLETIGDYSFYNCTSLSKVITPSSLRHINKYAFSGCSGMTTLYFKNGLQDIGARAFSNCTGLTKLFIPISVTSIEKDALMGIKTIKYLEVQGNAKDLGRYPFGASGIVTKSNMPDPGYNDSFNDSYEVTVPSDMEVGKDYTVSASGTIKDGKRLSVKCSDSITLKSVDSSDTISLSITFSGISLFGEGNTRVSQTVPIKVNPPSEEKAGTFKGVITYEINLFY